MFPMAGHSVQWIWTGFGVRPPYNLRMVTRGLFLQRNRATPEHRGEQFSNVWRKGSSSSYQPIGYATCCRQSCADLKILRPHQSADSDHRSVTASACRCCLGSAVSPRVCYSLADPLYTRACSRSAVCPIHLSVAGSLKYITAAAAQHGHGDDWDRARPSALYHLLTVLGG